jgi:MMPL family
MPATAASSIAVKRSAELFGDASSNNVNYVVLQRDRPLRSTDRRYHDALVTALPADTVHVYSVSDLWAAPITELAAQSRDGHAADVMLRMRRSRERRKTLARNKLGDAALGVRRDMCITPRQHRNHQPNQRIPHCRRPRTWPGFRFPSETD